MKDKYTPFLHCFQVLKVLLIKVCKMQPLELFLVIFVAFTSEDIIFHMVLELHSTLSEKYKIDFCHKFSFFNRFTQPPSPPP